MRLQVVLCRRSVAAVAAAPVAAAAPVDEFDGMFDDLDGPDEFDFDGL